MLSYMIPSDEQGGKSGNGTPPQQPQPQQPLIHKARGRPPSSPAPAPQGTSHNGVVVVDREVPVNGQPSATTTVVVDDGGTTTTTTFSTTSNVNGAVHTTKKIIKTYREQPLAPCGGMSTESSASSLSTAASDAPGQAATPTSVTSGFLCDKPKPKLLANGTKNPGLKRVSFGSSKGSMVETLIYESPLHEEPEVATPTYDQPPSLLLAGHRPPIDPTILEQDPSGALGADRVRVTFFESSKPCVVEPPDGSDVVTPEDLDAPPGMAADSHNYVRQTSTDSGWDNPFRPDGDLSREADEIVELIKGGKPITPTPGSAPGSGAPGSGAPGSGAPGSPTPANAGSPTREPNLQQAHSSPVTSTPHKNGANGSAAPGPGAVEVQRGTVASSGAPAQVEHVVLKKKPKCECCIVQ